MQIYMTSLYQISQNEERICGIFPKIVDGSEFLYFILFFLEFHFPKIVLCLHDSSTSVSYVSLVCLT
jgi:hypothetical protein